MSPELSAIDEKAPPALFGHCCRMYKAMLDQALPVEQIGVAKEDIPDDVELSDKDTIMVYEGFLTDLVTRQCSLSVPYYTSARRRLMAMGCIRQLRRGGGTSPSQWELIYEPTLEAFMKAEEKKVPKQTQESAAQQQLLSLNKRVTELEDMQQDIIEALAQFLGTEPADQYDSQTTEGEQDAATG
jgi:hypothetical protein